MAKILFINPVIRQEDNPKHISYGIAQLVALVVKEGHLVQVFDANAWRPTDRELNDVIAADSWDVVATGGLVTTYGYIKKTVRITREICPNALIIVGGGVITPIPHDIMRFLPEVDIGVIGEGYITFLELLKQVNENDRNWKKIKGIIYRDNEQGLQLTGERPLLDDVNTLPLPAWDMFPMDIYFQNSSLLLSEEAMVAKRHMDVVASYGCPYKCKFCFHLGLSGEIAIVGEDSYKEVSITAKRRVRHHNPQYVVDMVKDAKERFDIDFISFLDENFAALARKTKWFDEFEELWMKAGLQPRCIKEKIPHDPETCNGVHWGAMAHAAVVNLEILKRFKRLGCSYLDYGLESFSDDILKTICKGAKVKDNENAVLTTLKAGIRPIPNQIIGFPDESFSSILANIDAWQRLGIQSFPFFATPYPGCDWYFQFKDRILEQYKGNLEDFLLDLGDATKITAVISNNFTAVELIGLRELMVNRDIKRIEEHEKSVKKHTRFHVARGKGH